ncbi:hypothetical protein GCM10027184_67690 [Saccharothrix stipae]
MAAEARSRSAKVGSSAADTNTARATDNLAAVVAGFTFFSLSLGSGWACCPAHAVAAWPADAHRAVGGGSWWLIGPVAAGRVRRGRRVRQGMWSARGAVIAVGPWVRPAGE